MIKKLICLSILAFSTTVFAQHYKSYDWKDNPKIHEITEEEQKESSVAILKKHIVEYYMAPGSYEPTRFETEHKIIRVNNDLGIARHNTVYIPMYNVKRVIDIKARTISASGKVVYYAY